jgi:alkylresorcinol/alkylpyrone synthase
MHAIRSLSTDDLELAVTAADTTAFLASTLSASDAERFGRFAGACRIRRRRSLASYGTLRRLRTLEERQALHSAQAARVGERVGREALRRAGIEGSEVDVLIVVSSTGSSVPTLDRQLASRLALRSDARCLFLSGTGCAGALRAIGLASDLLAARPGPGIAVVVSVELCSPWLQVAEPSPDDVLASLLFGDGASAAVIGGAARDDGTGVVSAHSESWPESLDARGVRLTQYGLRHFTSPALPRALRAHLPRTVESFLARQGVGVSDLRFFAIAPSDHRVLESVASLLRVPEALMRPSWEAWEERGNTVSSGTFYVLDALRRGRVAASGDLGLAVALGPGLTCDLALLRWGREPRA